MRVAVTGAAGYVGSRLVERMRLTGHDVLGFDREAPADTGATRFIRCDLLDSGAYAGALQGVDLLCHLAAAKGDWGISYDEYRRDNVSATETLLAAARKAGVRNWIFYSTVSVLGPSETSLDERAPRRPVNPYGASKAECEAMLERYASEDPGARVVMIRPAAVYGPGNPWNTNVFRLIDAIYRGRFVMIGQGRDVKATAYIDNLLDATMFLVRRQQQHPAGVETYHYVDEPGVTTGTLVSRIHAHLAVKPRRFRLPLALASPLALLGDAASSIFRVDLPITSARVRKFCTATHFSAHRIRDQGYVQRASNEEAIQATVQWYLSEYLTAGR